MKCGATGIDKARVREFAQAIIDEALHIIGTEEDREHVTCVNCKSIIDMARSILSEVK